MACSAWTKLDLRQVLSLYGGRPHTQLFPGAKPLCDRNVGWGREDLRSPLAHRSTVWSALGCRGEMVPVAPRCTGAWRDEGRAVQRVEQAAPRFTNCWEGLSSVLGKDRLEADRAGGWVDWAVAGNWEASRREAWFALVLRS